MCTYVYICNFRLPGQTKSHKMFFSCDEQYITKRHDCIGMSIIYHFTILRIISIKHVVIEVYIWRFLLLKIYVINGLIKFYNLPVH